MTVDTNPKGHLIPTATIKFKPMHPDTIMPTYGTEFAAGADLSANLALTFPGEPTEIPLIIKRGARKLVKTGVSVEMPSGYWAEVRGRSSLAYKHGIAILGGVIDSDYRGDIGVIMHNTSEFDFVVRHGDRIAQLIFNTYVHAEFELAEQLSESGRGENGFGSTGVSSKVA